MGPSRLARDSRSFKPAQVAISTHCSLALWHCPLIRKRTSCLRPNAPSACLRLLFECIAHSNHLHSRHLPVQRPPFARQPCDSASIRRPRGPCQCLTCKRLRAFPANLPSSLHALRSAHGQRAVPFALASKQGPRVFIQVRRFMRASASAIVCTLGLSRTGSTAFAAPRFRSVHRQQATICSCISVASCIVSWCPYTVWVDAHLCMCRQTQIRYCSTSRFNGHCLSAPAAMKTHCEVS